MTKQDFFRIIIKVFGLYALISSVFSGIPTLFSQSLQNFGISGIALVLGISSILFFLIILLIFKADVLIRWLKLNKGFDDDRFDISNIDSEAIIKLSAIVIGGFLFIDNLPKFISNSYYAFKLSNMGDNFDYRQNIYWATSGLNMIVGYWLVSNHSKVPNLFREKKNNA